MADCSSGVENVQNEHKISHHTRKQENYQGLLGLRQQNSGVNLKRLPLVQVGQPEHQ